MKITDVDISGFGVWTGLGLKEIENELTVFYGANEAGKTTLMQFVRGMLYGFGDGRRRRYFPPVHGGKPGGRMRLSGDDGSLVVGRIADLYDPAHDRISIVGIDGSPQSEGALAALLSGIDEPTYKNVFAVGLREMQELGTLGDTEASRWLYGLTTGLDRVSLADVMRELSASRERIYSTDGRPSRVSRLSARRDSLRREIDELGGQTERWLRLDGERRELDAEIAGLESRRETLDREARLLDAAIALRGPRRERLELEAELAAAPPVRPLPLGGLARLEKLNLRLEQYRQKRRRVRAQRRAIQHRAAKLSVDRSLWRQSPRIEALAEQEGWVRNLEAQTRELETEIAALEMQSHAQRREFGLDGESPLALNRQALNILRAPARSMHRAKDELETAERSHRQHRDEAASLAAQIKTNLGSETRPLNAAMEDAGAQLARLRRRGQLDERLEQMERSQSDLDRQCLDLLDRQMLPLWVLVALGSIFVVGVVLLLAKLWMPESVIGGVGGFLAVLGAVGCGAAGLTKYLLERTAAQNLENCRKQIELLRTQSEQAKAERDEIDRQLPSGGGPLATRLRAAEARLATLEQLMPLETRRQAAENEAEAARVKVSQTRDELVASRENWRSVLASVGLSENLTPKQVRVLTGRGEQVFEWSQRLAAKREELARRRGELAGVSARVRQLLAEVELEPASPSTAEQIVQLVAASGEQATLARRRRGLRRRAKHLRWRESRLMRRVAWARERREALFSATGAATEEEFRRRASEFDWLEELRRNHESLAQKIATLIPHGIGHSEIAELFSGETIAELDARRDACHAARNACHDRLAAAREKRGALAEQLRALAADRTLDRKKLELAAVDRQLADAVHAWQIRAVCGRLLDEVRTNYERHRQPETLVEASAYLERLTAGHYTRVWTPLGEETLRVDDNLGRSLAVDILSRGTREQLFLSLRLALVSMYARRGASLPVVLDDVLGNFDAERAKAAASVLRDFARDGHQLLVFTCHEHVWKMFKSLKADVRRLPSSTEALDAEAFDIDDVTEDEAIWAEEVNGVLLAAAEQQQAWEDAA